MEAKKMSKNAKIPLTKPDCLERMCFDIRAVAREVRFGTIWFPCKSNPSFECKVHNGLVTQVEITFTNDYSPDRKKVYRSD